MAIDWSLASNWGTLKLGIVAPEESSQIKPSDFPTTTFNYWGLDAIEKNQFVEPPPNLILGSEVLSTCVQFDTEHVLYSKLRPYLNKVIVPSVAGIGTTEWIVLKPNPGLLDRCYLAYVLRTKQFVDYATANSTGARMPRARKDALRDAEIPVPYPSDPDRSLETQRRIVARIEALFAELRAARELHEKVVDDTGRIMDAMLAEVFGNASEGRWERYALGELVDNHDNLRIPLKKADRKNMQGQYPYYGATGIIDHVNAYLYDGEYLLISEDGANLLARKYPIGFIVSGKFWVNNHAHVVKARPKTSNQYLAYAIAATDISHLVTGAAQPKLNQSKMNEIPIWLPEDDSMQAQIVSFLQQMESEILEMRRMQAGDRCLIKDLEDSILAQAFRGEL
jgi:type I restriction enzyme, S subunit